ncbi:MAG: acetylglutamate kinase [Candidatus Pelagibacter sp.]|nr:acetylglutamate kinase [Candidatus Pelagibacter sp.]|tara:strand:+ start:8935 stop:9804 length:870 start_codon:yes stop_codon:yes gene_type:complete
MSEEKSLDEIKKFWPNDAPDVNNVPKYVKKYKKDLLVIKYGGNVLIDRNIFNNFIQDISILNRLGLSIVVVHGGGPRIERELKKENIQSKFINGLRVTDKKVINIVEKVLIDFNNDIVSSLNKKGSNAVSINTKVNNIINVIPDKPELGFVGVPQKIDLKIIKNLINQNQIPIVAPLGLDKENQTYNINGDTAASAIAKKLKSRRLLLMTNVEGVYDDRKALISEIKPYDMENLVNLKIVQGGMIPKIKNCIDAVENGVRGVVILDGRKPRSILKEIFSDKGAGTLIRK